MKYLDTKKNSLEEAVSQAMSGYVAKDLLDEGGKYLKYSDLLLQKGRLLAKKQNTAMIDKEISKEMKKLGIQESKEEYEKFFNSAMKKFGVDSPADFKDAAKKKEFFNYVDKNYKGKSEELDKEDEKSVDDVVKGLKKAVKTHQGQVKSLTKDIKDETDLQEGKMKELASYIAKGMSAQQIAKKMNLDVKAIEALMKEQARNDIKEYIQSDGTRRKVKEGDKRRTENKLNEKDLNKNVDETLDAVREANVAKQKSMREILADIWNMNEGKSPFELEEQNIKIVFDMVPDKDFDNFVKRNKLKTKQLSDGPNTGEVEVTGDKRAIEKLLKLKGEKLSDYKMDSRTKSYIYDEVDLKEAASVFISSFEKGDANMKDSKKYTDAIKKYGLKSNFVSTASKNGHEVTGRNINDITKFLSDFFGKDEFKDRFKKKGNSYEDMDEGFSSDAQRKAAFASGYKEKDKKESKTATGEKPTKVELDPKVK